MTRAASPRAQPPIRRRRSDVAAARRHALRDGVMMSVLMIAVTLGAIFFVLPIILQQGRDEIALKSRGVDAVAEVLRTWSVPGGARTGPSYHVRFAFQGGPGSSTVVDEAYVTRGEYQTLQPGARAPIVFDPQRLSLAQINFADKVRRRHPIIENTLWTVLLFGIIAMAWMGHIMLLRDTLRDSRRTALTAVKAVRSAKE